MQYQQKMPSRAREKNPRAAHTLIQSPWKSPVPSRLQSLQSRHSQYVYEPEPRRPVNTGKQQVGVVIEAGDEDKTSEPHEVQLPYKQNWLRALQ